jgi:glycosyltransferase involved in cell wall biosynthesis
MYVGSDGDVQPTTNEMNRTPLVSIIIPYYNQQLFIAETVLSAKRQTYPKVEIIVVDDGSPVPAESYLREIEGIQLFRTENHGCPATRNFGFGNSSGEYLIFLDGDDILMPGAIEAHLRALAQHPGVGLTFGPSSAINEQGIQIRPAHICRPRRDYFLTFLESNPICSPGATMIPRGAFVEAGMFDERLRSQVDDLDLYLRLARKFRVTQHDFCVLGYRMHSSNVSNDQEKMLKGTLALLDKIEASDMLTPAERRHLRYGRNRWIHVFRPQRTLVYRLRRSYYKVRAMFDVPLRAYYNELKASMR